MGPGGHCPAMFCVCVCVCVCVCGNRHHFQENATVIKLTGEGGGTQPAGATPQTPTPARISRETNEPRRALHPSLAWRQNATRSRTFNSHFSPSNRGPSDESMSTFPVHVGEKKRGRFFSYSILFLLLKISSQRKSIKLFH